MDSVGTRKDKNNKKYEKEKSYSQQQPLSPLLSPERFLFEGSNKRFLQVFPLYTVLIVVINLYKEYENRMCKRKTSKRGDAR